MIVDSHCHLDALDYDKLHIDVADVIGKAKARGVEHLLSVSVTLSRYEKMRDMLKGFDNVSLSCGVHPLDISDEPFDGVRMLKLAQEDKVIAIGETGLDYYYSSSNKLEQQSAFAQQIEIANELKKPLIVHTRDAREDTIALLKEGNAQNCGGVLHCFTENQWMAEKALELGFYISISGIITFKNAEALRDVVRNIPLDRLLIETDSPYLAPVPYRGKQNQPAYVKEVGEYLATLKGVSADELMSTTSQNFEKLLNISLCK